MAGPLWGTFLFAFHSLMMLSHAFDCGAPGSACSSASRSLLASNATTAGTVFAAPAAQQSYAIDWTQVPSQPVSSPVEVTGLGTCGCDLTANGCDTNCCCDPDCDTPLQDLFTGCVPQGPPAPALDYCVPAAQVARVNLHNSGGLGIVQTDKPNTGFLSQQLCIVRENNAELGQFFADPPPATVEDLAAAATQPEEYPFVKADTPGGASGSATFSVNNSVPAAYNFPGGSAWLAAEIGGVFALPAPALSAACDRLSVIGFMIPIESSICERYSTDLSSDCAQQFSAEKYINWLEIGKTRGATPSQQGGYVGVTVTSVQILDPNTEALNSTPLPATAANLPTPLYDNTTLTCKNALSEVFYTISHNGRGTITKVEASIILSAISENSSGGAVQRQQYSVAWIRDGTASAVRPRSGNPGYIPGLAVLAGTLASQGGKQAINRFVGGLPRPAAGPGGLCGGNYFSAVEFAANSLSTCSVPFTVDQLRSFCQNTQATPLPLQLLGGLFSSGQDVYVGKWANADVSNSASWQRVLLQSANGPMTWSEGTLTCKNAPTGLKYELLTAKVGAIDNPQRQISFVRVTVATADWTFQDPMSPFAPQRFLLQTEVLFLPLHQPDAIGVSPPPPPLLPTLPDDIFYPFYISSSGRLLPSLLWTVSFLVVMYALT